MICKICHTECYRQSETDPQESCLCGEMAWGSLWNWDNNHRIYVYWMWLRYRISEVFFAVGNWLIKDNRWTIKP
jgi:hypothetical protein